MLFMRCISLLVLLPLVHAHSLEPRPDSVAPPTAALLEIRSPDLSERESKSLSERLFQEAFRAKAWRLLERRRVQEILSEKALTPSSSLDSSGDRAVGSLLGVDRLLIPELDRLDGIIYLSLREVDARSGTVLRLAEVETEASLRDASRELAREAFAQLLDRAFPEEEDSATLVVEAPTAESVWIDGRNSGQPPVQVRLPVGWHRVSLEPGQTRPPPPEASNSPTIVILPAHSHTHSHHHPHGGGHLQSSQESETAAILGGLVAVTAGVAMVAVATSAEDSAWDSSWKDVELLPGDTAKVVFQREADPTPAVVGMLGFLAVVLGITMIALATSSP